MSRLWCSIVTCPNKGKLVVRSPSVFWSVSEGKREYLQRGPNAARVSGIYYLETPPSFTQWITMSAFLVSSEKIFQEARDEKVSDLEGNQEIAILRGGFSDFQRLYKVFNSNPPPSSSFSVLESSDCTWLLLAFRLRCSLLCLMSYRSAIRTWLFTHPLRDVTLPFPCFALWFI
jgi:hypothetical protein